MKKYYLCILFLVLAIGAFAQDTTVHVMAQQMPKFNGDIMVFLSDHVSYPPKGTRGGTVVVSFVIEKDGSVNNIRVIQSVEHALDSAAMACVKAMPKWLPGMQNGVPVRVKYDLPIRYDQPIIEQNSKNPEGPVRIK